MRSSSLPDVPAIDEFLRPDSQEIGLYLVGLVKDADPGQEPTSPGTSTFSRSVAVAVVEAANGLVLAWDGWYYFDGTTLPTKARPQLRRALETVSDWEGDPELALLNANLQWLGTEVGRHLFAWQNSPSATAARLLASSSGGRDPLVQGEVVAALPLHDQDLEATIARCNHDIRSYYPDWPGRPLDTDLRRAHDELGISAAAGAN